MKIASNTRILLIDDDNFHRKGVKLYLQQKGLCILEAGDAATAWQLVVERNPDAVILDIVLPVNREHPLQPRESVGVDLARRLKHDYPSLGIVLFSAHEDRGRIVTDLIRDGMRGVAYKLKGCPPAELLMAVDAVLAGRVVIDSTITNAPSLADELLNRLSPVERRWVEQAVALFEQLTPRERDVAGRVAAAHSIDGIAQVLNVTPKTVENHINHIYQKLGLNEMHDESPDLRRSVVLTKICLIHSLRAGERG